MNVRMRITLLNSNLVSSFLHLLLLINSPDFILPECYDTHYLTESFTALQYADKQIRGVTREAFCRTHCSADSTCAAYSYHLTSSICYISERASVIQDKHREKTVFVKRRFTYMLDVFVDEDECLSSPCAATGICYDEFRGHRCICLSGYTGEKCDVDIDDCLSNPCVHGTCTDAGADSYTCTCDTGYGGDNCELDYMSYEEDVTIADNLAVGKAVLVDMQTFLTNPSTTEIEKTAFHSDMNSLITPSEGRSCCRVIVPPVIRQSATTVTYVCTSYHTAYYYTGCGFLNLGRCTRTRTDKRYNVCYREETSYYEEAQPCLEHLVTCCQGYIWYKNTACLNIIHVQTLLDGFTQQL